MWRPYPEVLDPSPFHTHFLISLLPGFPHFSNVHRPAAVVAGNRSPPSLIHHIRRVRFRLRADWRHVAGVGRHWRRQCKFCVWSQVRFHQYLSHACASSRSLPVVPCLWLIRKRPFLSAVQRVTLVAGTRCCRRCWPIAGGYEATNPRQQAKKNTLTERSRGRMERVK
jgi:hypothetical protein